MLASVLLKDSRCHPPANLSSFSYLPHGEDKAGCCEDRLRCEHGLCVLPSPGRNHAWAFQAELCSKRLLACALLRAPAAQLYPFAQPRARSLCQAEPPGAACGKQLGRTTIGHSQYRAWYTPVSPELCKAEEEDRKIKST